LGGFAIGAWVALLWQHNENPSYKLVTTPITPPSYIRVRAIVWAYDRGQTDRQTDSHTDARDHNTFASSTSHAKCNKWSK